MTEVATAADFSRIRYAQCWEDADVLVAAIKVQPGAHYASIASAGDNSFSLLAQGAGRVVGVDMNPAQIACVELRRAAYQTLEHGEFLALFGARPSEHRAMLLERCARVMRGDAAEFWRRQPEALMKGCAGAGKFERYFEIFRTRALPLVHGRRRVDELLRHREAGERLAFYERKWNTWRWRLLFKLFFSRALMGKLGRDPRFFKYVDGSVAERILLRTRHALAVLDPAANPYLHWILRGTHGAALPHAWRAENYDAIRARLHLLEVRKCSVEEFLERERGAKFQGFNLSDIFEYMSEESMEQLYEKLLEASGIGARLVYWNMLAPRKCPARFLHRVACQDAEAAELFHRDQAFFYSALRIEEVTG